MEWTHLEWTSSCRTSTKLDVGDIQVDVCCTNLELYSFNEDIITIDQETKKNSKVEFMKSKIEAVQFQVCTADINLDVANI